MKSHYLFQKKENHIILVIVGEFDKNEFMTYPKLLLDECKKENVNKVIIDALNLIGTDITTMDRFDVGESIANHLRGVKLAVVWPKEHINKFTETVAINRVSLINIVDTIDAAQKWLLS
jgi:anti-anti-sigma regulatory factor